MLLSIIIPAYNAEKYLKQCLDALVTSNYSETLPYEVIIINDGSKDSTATIASKYAEKYSFIKYAEQTNSGVSAARNAGLKLATGRYITFVDADDTLLELDNVLNFLYNSNSELIIGDFNEINTKGEIVRTRELSISINDSRKALDTELLGNYLLNTCWGKFYLNSIIKNNNIEFPLNVRMGEDLIFVLNYVQHIRTFECMPMYIYNYLQLDSGAVRRLRSQINPELISDKVKCIEAKKDYMEKNTVSDEAFTAYYEYQLADVVSNVNMMLKTELSRTKAYQKLRMLTTTPAIKDILRGAIRKKGISRKRKLIARIYLHSFSSMVYVLGKYLKKKQAS